MSATRLKKLAVGVALAITTAVPAMTLTAMPAHALANEGGSGGTVSQDDLVKQGYKCEVVSAKFVECTKSGSPTYWCTSQVCTQAPAGRPPRQPNRFVHPGGIAAAG